MFTSMNLNVESVYPVSARTKDEDFWRKLDNSRLPSGSASSASGYSLRSSGSSAKISAFCPRSTSKLTQSIIKDHMISHYRKVYSAKAAIDTSAPKSLLYSVKYTDQLKREGTKSRVRLQSAHSVSQRSRASCSATHSRLSLQSDNSPYLSSRGSTTSFTPRPSTSFHPRSTVYSSYRGDHHRPSSGSRQRSLQTSLAQQFCYKTFQDPVQKTYSGDLLEKHAPRFTEDKPFTPKTLKSDKSSYLSKSRYYRAPQRTAQEGPTSSLKHHKLHRSTSNRKSTQDIEEQSQGLSTEHELSEDDLSHSYVSVTIRERLLRHESREQDVSRSFHRVSYESTKSPISMKVDPEEEELKYLEFITAVTEDILSRGFISDSVVERVINRHIDMNQYHLNESKMRHLLKVLRKDLKQPCNSPINTLNFERQEDHLPNSFQQNVDYEEDTDRLQYISATKTSNSIDYTSPELTSTLISECEKTFVQVELNEEKGTISSHVSKYSSFSEEDVLENQSDDKYKDETGQSDASVTPVKERHDVGDLGTALESLNVSDLLHCETEEKAHGTSDDEF
ncbi:spermatogenesis-associated protein 7 [Eucyclogobius newberryi]|uniref:spermatogenesis-associated protein 7 n=1 Tax=Eucyclogobius newberryi TaxID=166745 RepID=UPI003B58FB61